MVKDYGIDVGAFVKKVEKQWDEDRVEREAEKERKLNSALSPLWGKNSEPSSEDLSEEEENSKKKPKSRPTTTQTKMKPTSS